MATLKPIPDSTWLRLAALEPRCHISMWRDQQWLVHGSGGRLVWGVGGPPAPTRRVWRVRVFLRGSARTHDIIDADEPHLADGLERAIAEAEQRGWHAPYWQGKGGVTGSMPKLGSTEPAYFRFEPWA